MVDKPLPLFVGSTQFYSCSGRLSADETGWSIDWDKSDAVSLISTDTPMYQCKNMGAIKKALGFRYITSLNKLDAPRKSLISATVPGRSCTTTIQKESLMPPLLLSGDWKLLDTSSYTTTPEAENLCEGAHFPTVITPIEQTNWQPTDTWLEDW